MRALAQELAHESIHTLPGQVLWCDGDHGFNPYDYAELNLTRGHSAEDGADRILVKRCMTPFQWDAVLTQHLAQKLATTEASLALVLPYDNLYSTDEIKDWEAEDFVRCSLKALKSMAQRHGVPILLGVDMQRWWHTHPALARMTAEAADARWMVERPAGRLRVLGESGQAIDPTLRRTTTLLDYLSPEQELELEALEKAKTVLPEVPVPLPQPKPRKWRHT